jgi:hypothetical protein
MSHRFLEKVASRRVVDDVVASNNSRATVVSTTTRRRDPTPCARALANDWGRGDPRRRLRAHAPAARVHEQQITPARSERRCARAAQGGER